MDGIFKSTFCIYDHDQLKSNGWATFAVNVNYAYDNGRLSLQTCKLQTFDF